MKKENKEIKCPWCGESVAVSIVKATNSQSEHEQIVERRCPKCDKVLAAYLKKEGEFFPRIRTF